MNSMMLIARPILRPGFRSSPSFDTRAAGRSDDRRVHGSRRKDHAVAGRQLDRSALPLEHEGDRSFHAVQDLLVAVGVRAVAISWSVRPRVAPRGLLLEARHQVVEGHAEPILRLLRWSLASSPTATSAVSRGGCARSATTRRTTRELETPSWCAKRQPRIACC